jgi:hypothetical protein
MIRPHPTPSFGGGKSGAVSRNSMGLQTDPGIVKTIPQKDVRKQGMIH